jgi:carbonic anhydrase
MKMLRRITVFGTLAAVLAACGGASTMTVSIKAADAYRLAEATVQRAYAKSETPGIAELNAAFETEREKTTLPENWRIETVTETEVEVQLWVPGGEGEVAGGASHGRQARSLVVESGPTSSDTTVPNGGVNQSTTTVVLGAATTSASTSTSTSTSTSATNTATPTTEAPELTSETSSVGEEGAETSGETTLAPTTTVVMKVALAACIIKDGARWVSSSEPCERHTEHAGAEHKGAEDGHAAGPAHWSYEGETGPNRWSDLDPSYAACADGSIQTPVDIKDTVQADLPDPVISYAVGRAEIVNNGHTVQANASAGNVLSIDGVEYPFVQIHFHAQSEHTINGKHFDAEVHFVHKREDGKIAVVGVMLEKGASTNKAWTPYIDGLTVLEGSSTEVNIDWNAMLPMKRDTFRYKGSLTTPPCTEGVSWILMQNPVQLSAAQIEAFQKAYGHNYRPVQAIGSRVIQADKAS